MISDRIRMDAYAQALRRTVGPGTVVADIGCGTGIFTMLACELGAARVYAIEPNDAIQIARQCAAANGWADHVSFIQAKSTKVDLPEKVDVIVSDLRGLLPLYDKHIASIQDACQRFLRQGGVLIPEADTLWLALLHAPDFYQERIGIWTKNPYKLDLEAAQRFASNAWTGTYAKKNDLLTGPGCWAELDYRTVETPHLQGSVELSIDRPGVAHGAVVWFDARLQEDIGFSNAPGKPELIYRQGFFPFPQPIAVTMGERVVVDISAHLVHGDYVWRWNTHLYSDDQTEEPRLRFDQSTFQGTPLSTDALRRQAEDFEPRLDDEGRVVLHAMEALDSGLSLRQIANYLAQRFDTHFTDAHDALAFVGSLSQRYCR